MNKSTDLFSKVSPIEYKIDVANITKHSIDKIWLVFPNPSQRGLDNAKLIISLLVGLITTVFQAQVVRDRRPLLSASILLVSISAIGFSAYYAIVLAKGFEFVVWVAVLLPHAFVALITSIYLFFARQYQATVAGTVTLDQRPVELSDVTLFGGKDNDLKPITKVDRLRNGQYLFYIWIRKNRDTYEVQAQSGGTQTAKSQRFALVRRARKQVEPLDLRTIVTLSPQSRGVEIRQPAMAPNKS